ncbi:uncharacterized protein SCHCODRAFT_02135375 [Schizophyllum commune H4-8]|uniref:uncharacterized protein n=1 Tax=Schizophyllum commune (strain H4-8 / FGSC 9210) TaxID=578458 RepID=UPI002160A96E|nr:uncharacterized protein SCHCODRAFT_02135375 [Schizophyllum commune H4-8]KAI5884836.1 hypothetical protein SCHCODRAFT_02135375 [Schizophyllum commune H4-8]
MSAGRCIRAYRRVQSWCYAPRLISRQSRQHGQRGLLSIVSWSIQVPKYTEEVQILTGRREGEGRSFRVMMVGDKVEKCLTLAFLSLVADLWGFAGRLF